ncbi:hypothetical protein LIER_19918 [Lithospermum erythrorhizon]|uniref:RNase H type-1 domain-containing protein n=1 Tax=Lithospermum erythrorhizon TaxID=34254 RepID=A0AAV3QJJ5_LITER
MEPPKSYKEVQKQGRLTTWAVELSEFELSYIPRISVKAQALAAFVIKSIAKASPQALMQQIEDIADPKEFEWYLHVDGARNDEGVGAGGNSKLVIDQIQGKYGVKNEVLKRYHSKVVFLAQGFARIEFRHLPREENEEADRLSRLATTYYSKFPEGVYVEMCNQPTYEEGPGTYELEDLDGKPIVRTWHASKLYKYYM